MHISICWIPVMLAGAVIAGSACTQKASDDTTATVDVPNADTYKTPDAIRDDAASIADKAEDAGRETAEDTKNLAERTGDKAREIAVATADKTKEIAGAVGSKTTDVVSTTGEAITDSWITTRVSASFVNETLLKGSNIDVDTEDHVVTLTGVVGSAAAKARAGTIAQSTEGVTRVANKLVVK